MRAACATIHLGALRENLRRVRGLSPGAHVMAVVKADGYGHGLERVARALDAADAFGVAGIADGQRLRAASVSQRIVVLSGHDEPGDLAEMRRLRLDTVVHNDARSREVHLHSCYAVEAANLLFNLCDAGWTREAFGAKDCVRCLR